MRLIAHVATFVVLAGALCLAAEPTSAPASAPAKAAAEWPCFRGPTGDEHSPFVPASLPAKPQPRWKVALTEGQEHAYAGIVVADGKVIVFDHELDKTDIVRCLDADTGKELWKYSYDNTGDKIDYGSCPRSTPAIHGGVVISLGARGVLLALDLKKGEVLWQKDMVKDFGDASLPGWGYSSSPLIVGESVIVNPGSPRGSLVALDVKTGDTKWSASGGPANYGSFLLTKVKGTQQLISYDQEEFTGRDPADGSVIWSKPMFKHRGYVVPTPVVANDHLLICGEDMARVVNLAGAKGKLPEEWDAQSKDFIIGDQTPTLAGDVAMAVVTNKGLVGLDVSKDPKVLWKSGDDDMDASFCNVIYGDGRALVLDAGGSLMLFQVDRKGAKQHGKLQVCESTQSAPALTPGRIYLRDLTAVYCYDLPTAGPK